MKIAIASTFTIEPILSSLNFWLQMLQMESEVQVAPYGVLFQQLLQPDSLLNTNISGLNVLAVRLEDLVYHADARSFRLSDARNVAAELGAAIRSSATMAAASTVVVFCAASQRVIADSNAAKALEEMQGAICESFSDNPQMRTIHATEIAELYPVADYDEPLLDEEAHIPYTEPYFAALGTVIARDIYKAYTDPYKVIVVDCDNTLWQGVCAEDGAQHVLVSGFFADFQRALLHQSERGRIICLCSNNIASDVIAVFDHNDAMLLKKHHIAAMLIDWSPKSEKLRRLAAELNVAPSTMIYFDDDAASCAEVRANCSEVLTIQVPGIDADASRFVHSIWALDYGTLTAEDYKRSGYYRQEIQRSTARSEAPTFQSFLEKLELDVSFSPLTISTIARISQLFYRTTQFTNTAERLTVADIHAYSQQEGNEIYQIQVKDRFGDYGIVGATFLHIASPRLHVAKMLLSCRVLNRSVEYTILRAIAQRAKAANCSAVTIACVKTQRNIPMQAYLEGLHYSHRQQSAKDKVVYTVDTELLLTLEPSAAVSEIQRQSSSSTATVDQKNHPPMRRVSPAILNHIYSDLSDPVSILSAVWRWQGKSDYSRALEGVAGATESVKALVTREFCHILNIAQAEEDDDFFLMGGNSLLAALLVARLRERLHVSISLFSFVTDPTISGLTRAIQA